MDLFNGYTFNNISFDNDFGFLSQSNFKRINNKSLRKLSKLKLKRLINQY